MKLAYSTNAFTQTNIRTAIKSIADLGFAGIELLCDRPHLFPGEVSAEEAGQLRDMLTQYNLTISNLNVNTANGYFSPLPPENVFEPSLSTVDKDMRAWRQTYTSAAIQLAHQLGANCISVTSGHPQSNCLPEKSLAIFVDSLKRICEDAARYDVRVGIEYEPGLLVERATEALEVIERVGSPHLGVNLDIGHSYLDGETPEVAIHMLAGRIWNVHVEDIKDRKHYHLIPGEGDLPFERYFNALSDAGYEGFHTLELYTYTDNPVEAGMRSLEFLNQLTGAQ